MWIIFLIIFCIPAFADQQIILSTGYGYITNRNGHIVGKYSDSKDQMINLSEGFTYTDVADQKALDGIALYVSPEEKQKNLIIQNAKALSIADLQKQGIFDSTQATLLSVDLTDLAQAKLDKSTITP